MRYAEAEERPFESDEQALYEVVCDAARHAVDHGAATVAVTWHRWGEGPPWPTFELHPRNPGALPIAVSVGGGEWIDTTLIVDGDELSFELWAATLDERLARIRDRIDAVVDGRVDLRLRRHGWFLFRAWALVATFHLSSGSDETSRTPSGPGEYRHLFAARPRDETSGLLGPRQFARYESL